MEEKPGKSILFVAPYFAPAWSYGGPVKVSYDFAKALVRLNNRITVATTDALDGKHRNRNLQEKMDGISILRFKNFSNRLAKSMNFYYPFGLSTWLNQNVSKFDIVHIHEIFTIQSIWAARACKKFNIPYVIQPHGSLQPYARTSRFKFAKRLMIKYLEKYFLMSSGVIVLTEKEKNNVLKVYPKLLGNVFIAPNGIDTKELNEIKTINLRKLYHISEGHKLVGFLGRIHFQKGLDLALKALSLLKNEIKITFLIIGPDEGERANLEQLAQKLGITDNIIYTGLMSGKEKFETLKSTRVSILMSRSEGLPTSILESLGLGLPVICSENSNMPEIADQKAGFVVKDEQEAAEKIYQLLSDDHLRDEMSSNALKLAKRFDIKEKTDTLLKIYERKNA